jgi:hypothetical protein
MNIEWTQIIPALGIGWFLPYVFARWFEKRHIDEELERGTKAVLLSEKILALHEKACDRNVNIVFPLGKQAIAILPITDEELEENERQQLELMQLGQYWLVSLMWHCINLQHLKGGLVTLDRTIEHAEECFVSAYDEMEASAVMRDSSDITTTQIVHSYYEYITQKTEISIEAVVQAMGNWVEAHADDESEE